MTRNLVLLVFILPISISKDGTNPLQSTLNSAEESSSFSLYYIPTISLVYGSFIFYLVLVLIILVVLLYVLRKVDQNKKRLMQEISEGSGGKPVKNKKKTNSADQLEWSSEIKAQGHPLDERLNLKMLLVQLHYISHDYKAFGKQAGLSADVLSELDKFTSKPFDGLMKVCSLWFRRLKDENVKPTWEAVAEILFKMGLEKLALEILQGYTTGKLPFEVGV